jgi:hypothetical protein
MLTEDALKQINNRIKKSTTHANTTHVVQKKITENNNENPLHPHKQKEVKMTGKIEDLLVNSDICKRKGLQGKHTVLVKITRCMSMASLST